VGLSGAHLCVLLCVGEGEASGLATASVTHGQVLSQHCDKSRPRALWPRGGWRWVTEIRFQPFCTSKQKMELNWLQGFQIVMHNPPNNRIRIVVQKNTMTNLILIQIQCQAFQYEQPASWPALIERLD
jgi:hypothetical protein